MRRLHLLALWLPVAACGGKDRGTTDPEPPPAPPPWCDALQPHLDRATTAGGLAVPLACLPQPGIVDSAYFGTRANPTASTFRSCFEEAPDREAKLYGERPSAALDFAYRDVVRSQDAGGIDLALGAVGIQLEGLRVDATSVESTIRFTDVRFRTVSDLSSIDGACVERLCAEDSVYTPIVMVGKMTVVLVAGREKGWNIDVGATVRSDLGLDFSSERVDQQSGTLEMTSTEDVVFAASVQASRAEMGGICGASADYTIPAGSSTTMSGEARFRELIIEGDAVVKVPPGAGLHIVAESIKVTGANVVIQGIGAPGAEGERLGDEGPRYACPILGGKCSKADTGKTGLPGASGGPGARILIETAQFTGPPILCDVRGGAGGPGGPGGHGTVLCGEPCPAGKRGPSGAAGAAGECQLAIGDEPAKDIAIR